MEAPSEREDWKTADGKEEKAVIVVNLSSFQTISAPKITPPPSPAPHAAPSGLVPFAPGAVRAHVHVRACSNGTGAAA